MGLIRRTQDCAGLQRPRQKGRRILTPTGHATNRDWASRNAGKPCRHSAGCGQPQRRFHICGGRKPHLSDAAPLPEEQDLEPVTKGPAALYAHDHAPIRNVNEVGSESRRLGQRVADRIASVIGGWPFIIIQSLILLIWIVSNVFLAMHYKDKAFDPYPFILLNLFRSERRLLRRRARPGRRSCG